MCKAEIPSILKILNKIVITKDVYNKFLSIWYDERHIEPIIEKFRFFVKQRLDELEHPYLVTEWIHNMDTSAYL